MKNTLPDEHDEDKTRGVMNKWLEAFMESPAFDTLSEEQKDETGFIVSSFTNAMDTYVGEMPNEWSTGGVREVCLDVMPRKMTAETETFEAVGPILSTFFEFLHGEGLLNNGRELAQTARAIEKDIVGKAEDPRSWGMAKSFAMQAQRAGVDLSDKRQMNAFALEYNSRLASAMPPSAAPPAQSVPRPATPRGKALGPNEPCLCGSGKKFKKCCGRMA